MARFNRDQEHRLITFSRALTKRPTEAERRLWNLLTKHPVRFQRQVPFYPYYIADFACHAAKLIVEVDGPYHAKQHGKDHHRDQWFATQGYRVMRFSNEQVMEAPAAVLRQINTVIPTIHPVTSHQISRISQRTAAAVLRRSRRRP